MKYTKTLECIVITRTKLFWSRLCSFSLGCPGKLLIFCSSLVRCSMPLLMTTNEMLSKLTNIRLPFPMLSMFALGMTTALDGPSST